MSFGDRSEPEVRRGVPAVVALDVEQSSKLKRGCRIPGGVANATVGNVGSDLRRCRRG